MNYTEKKELIKELTESKNNFVESDNFSEFIIDCKLFLNPQSYGSRIEKRWIKDNGYKKIPSSQNQGDYKDGSDYVEFKASYESNGEWFLLQIRPYQKLDRYDIILIDLDMNWQLYQLTKEKMNEIIDKFGAVCHGTKDSNKDNSNLEYRVTLNREIIKNYF